MTKRAVWFVTGCSTGFGRELATQQKSQGVVTARDPADLAEFEHSSDALILKLDVTDPVHVTGVVVAGDPVGAIAAITGAVEGPNPSHHLLLGNTA